jgi:anti-sigma regulatory factor (Ser/Thr protein kinase)
MSKRDPELPLGPDAAAATVVISLPSDASAAAIARQFVEDNQDHIRPDLIEDAQVLVSEIVTNAVLHGKGQITLLVRVDEPSIGVAVADSGDKLPVKSHGAPPPSQPSGRGLMIVDALASAWGVTPNSDPLPGKVVWFELYPESTDTNDPI